MKGSERIAEILKEDYGVKNVDPWENIDYTHEQLSDSISRVKITSKTKDFFCCPVYAFFDGYHMSWYGDYGSFVFCCTWKTNINNLAYDSPYYQLEKLNSRDREEWNEVECEKCYLKLIHEGDWYCYTLSDEQRKRFDEYIKNDYDYIDYEDKLFEHEELCESIKKLFEAREDYFDWVSALRHTDLSDDDIGHVFGVEIYELYDIGKKAPIRFFIILYMLSVVANMENERISQNEN